MKHSTIHWNGVRIISSDYLTEPIFNGIGVDTRKSVVPIWAGKFKLPRNKPTVDKMYELTLPSGEKVFIVHPELFKQLKQQLEEEKV